MIISLIDHINEIIRCYTGGLITRAELKIKLIVLCSDSILIEEIKHDQKMGEQAVEDRVTHFLKDY